MLLLNILLYSIGSFTIYLAYKQQIYALFLIGLETAGNNFCHWIITVTYIKTSLETRMLLNKDTYLKSADEIVFVRNFRCYLKIANISASILIISFSVAQTLVIFYDSFQLQSITNNAILVFELICSVAWAWTLIRLYKDIAHSEQLLPNKHIFFIHGSLLTIYYVIYLV